MMNLLRNIKINKSGASAAEYALIVAVMGGLVVIGATLFGGYLKTALSNSGSAISASSGTGTAYPTTGS